MYAKHKHKSEYNLQDDLENLKRAIFDASNDVKGRTGEIMSESIQALKDKSNETRDSIGEYVQNKPFKSLGIALVAGLFLGLYMRK